MQRGIIEDEEEPPTPDYGCVFDVFNETYLRRFLVEAWLRLMVQGGTLNSAAIPN